MKNTAIDEELMIRYLLGELSEAEKIHIETHLEACGKCRAAFEEIRFGAHLAGSQGVCRLPLRGPFRKCAAEFSPSAKLKIFWLASTFSPRSSSGFKSAGPV